MGGDFFFSQMVQVSGALHIPVLHEQESGELTVDDVDGLNGGDMDETK